MPRFVCPECGSYYIAALPWTPFGYFCKECDADFNIFPDDGEEQEEVK